MAGTTTKSNPHVAYPGSVVRDLAIQFNKMVDDLEAIRANQERGLLYRTLGNPTLARKTNFDVENTVAFSYLNGGTLKTLAANGTWDTGTAATIATVRWAAAQLSISSAAALVLTWFTASGAGYATEAAAIAAMTAVAATDTPVGYITVLAAGITWTAGTDALASGTGGTPATTTNYYNSVNANSLYVTAAAGLTAAKVGNSQGTAITA